MKHSEQALMQIILSNLKEIASKAPNTYSAYVAELTLKTIEKGQQ